MAKQPISGVMLVETFARVRKKWLFRFAAMNLVYIIVIAGLTDIVMKERTAIPSFPRVKQVIDEYRTKDKLYGFLRTKGYSLGQGLDIVEAIVRKTKELDLPVALILAVIDQESEFYPNARSNQGAQGLMQIMPFKWDEYVVKLNLEVDRKAITDPYMNITVGCHILKDFYDRYNQIKDQKVRFARTLTDYNNGQNAVTPNLSYAVQVNQKLDQFERIMQ